MGSGTKLQRQKKGSEVRRKKAKVPTGGRRAEKNAWVCTRESDSSPYLAFLGKFDVRH